MKLQVIKDLVTILATCIATWIAITGIKAWKKQLKGKTEYEISRRYLKAVYRVRDSIKYVRNPFVPVEEIMSSLKKNGLSELDYNDNKKTNRAVYSERWKKVIEAASDLDVELLDVEVSWGKEAIEIKSKLQECITNLFVNLKIFLEENDYGNDVRDSIYSVGEGDEFNKKLNDAVREIEDYLRPHLK